MKAGIVALDLDARTATDDAGVDHAYEKLLLATGETPRRLPDGGDGVIYFRTVDDYRRLRDLAGDGGACRSRRRRLHRVEGRRCPCHERLRRHHRLPRRRYRARLFPRTCRCS